MTCPNMRTIRQIVTRLSTYGDILFTAIAVLAVIALAVLSGWALDSLLGPGGFLIHAAFCWWLGYSVLPWIAVHRKPPFINREQRGRVES